MPKDGNITKRQHYIPQVYLRGFSTNYQDARRDLPSSKCNIYCYDLMGNNKIMDPVPIKSICYEKYLYEITDSDGGFLHINHLEKFFSELERRFGCYRSKLERKVNIENNYKINCFLSTDEKLFWVTYISIQLLRIPQILKIAKETNLEIFGDKINEDQAKNMARMMCLPFWTKLEEGKKEVMVLESIFKPMLNMSFRVGFDRKAGIITSDRPAIIKSGEFPCEEYTRVVFPVTAQICLFMFGKEERRVYPKNSLFLIGDEQRRDINRMVRKYAFKNIYSNHLLDENGIL